MNNLNSELKFNKPSKQSKTIPESTLHSLRINATRASNALEPFNGPISRVNLPLFTLIERKGKVSETLILRFWTWVKNLKRNGNKKERKCDNRNVAET